MWVLLIDAGAMIGGMRLSSRIRGGLGEWASLTQHLTMLGGMTVGMMLGMWIRYATFESRALQSPIQAVDRIADRFYAARACFWVAMPLLNNHL